MEKALSETLVENSVENQDFDLRLSEAKQEAVDEFRAGLSHNILMMAAKEKWEKTILLLEIRDLIQSYTLPTK